MDQNERQRIRSEKLNKRVQSATDIFSDHVILERSENYWRLQRRDEDNTYWTEVFVGHRGSVVITGDGPDIILRSWRRTQSAAERANIIHWAGNSSINYLGSKVEAGRATEYDDEEARLDIDEAFECLLEGGLITAEQHEDLCDDLSLCGSTSVDEHTADAILERIYSMTCDYEMGPFGMVPSWDLLCARAACARLASLLYAELDAEKAAEAP